MTDATLFDIVLDGPANFDYEVSRAWALQRRHVALAIVPAYLISLFALKRTMKDRKAYSLQGPLVVWNSCLALFSMAGFYFCGREALETYQELGFEGDACYARRFFHGTSGYFAFLFVVSKVAELGDSYFLVLRKRPLTFLQYYHHSLTLLYCWFSYSEEPAYNRIGTVFNYAVHTVMYTYFLLRSLKIALPSFIAQCVTAFQIVQFITGCVLLMHTHTRVVFFGAICDWPLFYGYVALLMNISYLYLFVRFFYHAYIQGDHRRHLKQQ